MVPESLLAAVDLGSNSFRLEIGRIGSHQRIERVEACCCPTKRAYVS